MRKLFRQLSIKYWVPVLKPLHFFEKGKGNEVICYIQNICGYIAKGYRTVFVVESSLDSLVNLIIDNGTDQIPLNKICNSKCIKPAIGQNNLCCHQIILGTGKATILRQFLQDLRKLSNQYIKLVKFIIILNNCSIHHTSSLKQIFNRIPLVITLPQRPEFNLNERQTMLDGQFMYKITKLVKKNFLFFIHLPYQKKSIIICQIDYIINYSETVSMLLNLFDLLAMQENQQ